MRDHSLFMEGVGLARNEGGGGHDQSRRLEEEVIMKHVNKCGEQPNLLYTDSSRDFIFFSLYHRLSDNQVRNMRW